MPKKADIGSKRLISLAPDTWVKWVTQHPDAVAVDLLSSDFQWISRESDILIRAYSPQYGDFLVLNELQLRYNSRMPQRMRSYAALAEERYNLPTYPVLINILAPPASTVIPTRYESELMGLRATQDYRVINLWEVDANIAFQKPLPTLLPFVPILKGGGEESLVRQALQVLRNDEQLNELEPLLAFFASFVLEARLIQQIMRWDMTVLLESPWYRQFVKDGMLKLLMRMLKSKFGELEPEILEPVQSLSPEQLEDLGEELFSFSQIADLVAWLQKQEKVTEA
ncbi:MAG: Rpn family recombination-promoting nuclease/putative transposase [Symploca sp. SIO3E6]|nr:Rpn family recombination-promoting nuclease/putative transposase [Caldora sp. SIO3E6]